MLKIISGLVKPTSGKVLYDSPLLFHYVPEKFMPVSRSANRGIYHLSKVIYVLVIGLLADLICILFPVIQNVLNGSDLFMREVSFYNCANGFLIQGGCVFAKAALGSFLHPQAMKNRKMAIILTVLVAVLSLVKPILEKEIPFIKWVAWLFPPVMNASQQYGYAEYFQLDKTVILFIFMILYGSILSLIKSLLCHKNKF